jgi:hypothetical protein
MDWQAAASEGRAMVAEGRGCGVGGDVGGKR